MSLPAGVINRPHVPTHPQVLGRMLRLTLLNMFLMAPLVVYVAVQAPGIAIRYECTSLEKKIVAARLERRRLLAERARLLAPERLRREAEARGLAPASVADRPSAATAPRARGAAR